MSEFTGRDFGRLEGKVDGLVESVTEIKQQLSAHIQSEFPAGPRRRLSIYKLAAFLAAVVTVPWGTIEIVAHIH